MHQGVGKGDKVVSTQQVLSAHIDRYVGLYFSYKVLLRANRRSFWPLFTAESCKKIVNVDSLKSVLCQSIQYFVDTMDRCHSCF